MVACVFRSRTAVAPLERMKILLQVRSPDVCVPLDIFHSHPLECALTCKFCIDEILQFAGSKST